MTDDELHVVAQTIGAMGERLDLLSKQIAALALYSSMTHMNVLMLLMQKGTLTPQEIQASAHRILASVENEKDLIPAKPLAQGLVAMCDKLAAVPTPASEKAQEEAESASLQLLRQWASETKH